MSDYVPQPRVPGKVYIPQWGRGPVGTFDHAKKEKVTFAPDLPTSVPGKVYTPQPPLKNEDDDGQPRSPGHPSQGQARAVPLLDQPDQAVVLL